MMRIETTILNNLLQNEEYVRKVIPFIEAEYFTDFIEKTIFTTIKEYIRKYNDPPVVEALLIDVQKVSLSEEQYGRVKEYVDTHIKKTEVDLEWIINETEKWCKDKAIYNAIFTGIQIIDGKSKDQTPEAIPKILSVSSFSKPFITESTVIKAITPKPTPNIDVREMNEIK